MFTDQLELKDIPKADPEFVDLLKRVVTIQADCEIGGPHLYVDSMLPGAPARIDQLVVARTAAEEIDHFRKFAKVAGDLGIDTSFILSRPNQERYVEAFRGSITSWEDFAVFGFLWMRAGPEAHRIRWVMLAGLALGTILLTVALQRSVVADKTVSR